MVFWGGDYQANFSYRFTNGQIGTDQRSGFLGGENPTHDAVRLRAANPKYAGLLHLGNGFVHFNANGRPRIAAGFGIGGLDDPSSTDLWNWEQNLDRAVAEFDARFAEAEKYPEMMRQLGFSAMPDFTSDELKLHALQSLVGQPYFVPARGGSGWVPMRNRLPFADDVVQIAADVAAGNPLAGW